VNSEIKFDLDSHLDCARITLECQNLLYTN